MGRGGVTHLLGHRHSPLGDAKADGLDGNISAVDTKEVTPVLNGIPAPGNTFVLPEHKMLYVSVTKVACTSLRWMVADLAHEDLESFWGALNAHQTRLMTIHRKRSHWRNSPQLFEIPPSDR